MSGTSTDNKKITVHSVRKNCISLKYRPNYLFFSKEF
jgi:hypothetical protein